MRSETASGIFSPEKPLSDLGKLGYRSYWTEILLGALLVSRDQSNYYLINFIYLFIN